MKFSFAHNNINVKDLDKSLAFYKEALLLEESRRLEDPGGAFTWLKRRTKTERTKVFNACHGRAMTAVNTQI